MLQMLIHSPLKPRHSFKLGSKYISIICFLFTLSNLQGQETLTGIQREMARVEREIKREKELHQAEKKKAEDFEKRKGQKIAALNKQLTDLDKKIQEVEGRLGKLKAQKSRLASGSKHYDEKRNSMHQHIAKQIDSLNSYFKTDFPHQQERRIQNLNNLKQELRDGIISPEEGISRLFSILQEAINIGYDSEVFSGSYQTTDGQQSEGTYLRLGAVILAYVSLDGNTVAYQTIENQSYVWHDKDLNLELKQNIKTALAVAQGKAAPSLVLLPIQQPSKGEN